MISALGHTIAGLWTNDEELTADLVLSGNLSKDRVWAMPLLDEQREAVKGKIADLTNSSGKTAGSSAQAAAFLEYFVPEGVKWAHVDIAGTAMVDNCGTGYGSRLLVKYAQMKERK